MLTVSKWLAVIFGTVVAVLIVAIWWPVANAPLPDSSRDRLIANVRVVGVEQGVAGEPTSVLIRGGRIFALGPAANAPDLPVFDAQGGYLTPGFWDMHVHTFQLSPQLHLPLFVANGITGVRDMLDCPGERDALIACVGDKRGWTREVDQGRLAAPRIVEIASFYF